LVFFVSLLAVSGVRSGKLLMVGIPFCIASFLVYIAIGFGLMSVIHGFSGLPAIRRCVEAAVVAALGLLSALSFRDAWRYRAGGSPSNVTLQLPRGAKQLIHRVMRAGLSSRTVVPASFAVGAAVTVLETVCTGQAYLPTLVLVVASGVSSRDALLFLLLYNVMFVLPLVIVFTAVYFGLSTGRLVEWSRGHVVPAKVLLGLLFLALGGLILIF
jgi:hypothetical protein